MWPVAAWPRLGEQGGITATDTSQRKVQLVPQTGLCLLSRPPPKFTFYALVLDAKIASLNYNSKASHFAKEDADIGCDPPMEKAERKLSMLIPETKTVKEMSSGFLCWTKDFPNVSIQ